MIELLVVITVAALLLTLAIPSFTATINGMRLSTTSSQLVADMAFARREAIKRNSRMIVCVRNTAGTGCAGTGTDWGRGWVVCYDNETTASPGNGVPDDICDAAPADGSNPNPVIARAAQTPSITLAGTLTALRFSPYGTAVAIPAGTTPMRVTLRNVNSTSTRTVTVALTGSVSKL